MKDSDDPADPTPAASSGDVDGGDAIDRGADTGKTSSDPTADRPVSTVGTHHSAASSLFNSFPSLSRIMSVVVLVMVIIAVGLLFYKVMAGFFVPLFLAVLLVVIFRPVHMWILHRMGNRPRTAAAITTGLILTIVLMPLLLLVVVAVGQFASVLKQIDAGSLKRAIERGREQTALAVPHPEYFRRLDEIVIRLQSSEPQRIETSEVLQAKDILGSLQNDESISQSARDAATPAAVSAAESLDELLSEIKGWQNREFDDPVARSYVEDLDLMARLQQLSDDAGSKTRRWMQEVLGGSIWGPIRLAANLSDDEIDRMILSTRDTLQPWFVQFTSRTGGFLVTLGIGTLIMVISVYFFLIDGPGMVHTLMRLSPMDDNYERRLLMEFDRTSRAVVLASVLSALAQGVLAAIAYFFLGFSGSVVLLFLATTVMALVPFLGAASVWVPCVVWLGLVERQWGQAIFLLIYGTLVISSIDNVIKVFVLHGRSQLHPLLALLSVLGGVGVFGPIGILVGPMVVVFLQTLLEILNHELAKGDFHIRPSDGADETTA
ncbi:AI-2E family transporter [Crateriforma conspicua]|uniref:Putative inner membrane protein n=1 Tax=Crateriforma conspicua TaxID=2527996 RepID=A0A5C6FU87_9PLAN|nr:AI-2E family transporter [Crateriforma conspicua]TWU65901.1 putative inner membrane protein [Crateriforma conspicua]